MLGNNLKLGTPRDIRNPGDDFLHLELPFTVEPLDATPGRAKTSSHRLRIHLSDSRRSTWELSKEQAHGVMLVLGLNHLLGLLRERQPEELEKLFINHTNNPGDCPVDPASLPSLPSEPLEVERAKKPIGF